jgi:hypothetical protein
LIGSDRKEPVMFALVARSELGVNRRSGRKAGFTDSVIKADYPVGDANKFAGDLAWVQIDLEDDDVSHLEDPEVTYHRIMARQ